MGKSSKRSRKELEPDIGSQDESEMGDEMHIVENEYDSDDDQNKDNVEEEDSVDDLENEYDDDNQSKDNEEEEDGEEDDKDDAEQNDNRTNVEMEELEKELTDLRHKEQDLLRNIRHHKDDDLLKGQAVKNQKALWDKTLEMRFLLQKAFSSSNKLPKEPIKASFCDSDSRVNEAYSDLITSSKKTLDSLLELQEVLLEKNPSIAQTTNGNSGQLVENSEATGSSNGECDDEWLQISQMQSRLAPFRDKSIDKWQRKTQVTTGAAAIKGKLQAFNQNISEQVAAYMRDPSRMLKGMQQCRSTVAIFGTVPDAEGNAKEQVPNMDGDPELLDDSEFYQQLLKEFFEAFDPTSSETAFYALKRMQTKKRKIVDRRASKSRKIRYNVHEKIVNFMAPQPINIPPMATKLFENLFGLKTQKPVPVE